MENHHNLSDLSIFPMAGDVVFCTGNSSIKSVQAFSLIAHRKITHVAIMASSNDIAEGMVKRKIEVHNFQTWHNERRLKRKGETYFILRSHNAIEKTIEIQRRIAFYLNEPYRLLAVLDWMKAGRSICTSFVAKVLADTSIVSGLRGRSILFPGSLYKRLKVSGFRPISSDEFLKGARAIAGSSSFDGTLKLLRILDEMDSELTKMQAQMVGWTSVVEEDLRNDPLAYSGVWTCIAGKDILNFCEELSRTCRVFLDCIKLLKERGPQNWASGFENHERRIELLTKLASEHNKLIRIFSEILPAEHLQNAKYIPIADPNRKIYENIGYYLEATRVAAATFRAILGTT